MLALLPLRGWVGDAMAMEMVKLAPTRQATAPMPGHTAMLNADIGSAQTMHAECPGHASAHAEAEQATTDGDTSCTACQICHAVAMTPAFPQLLPSALPAAQPRTAIHHFASAERATGFKPPIF